MKKDYFTLTNKKIVLYGAASIGMLSKGYFERAGFFIDGFIDQRSGEIDHFLEKPVWGIDDVALDGKKTDDYVIYISVKNVFEHSNIANKLISRGFTNIIYRPLAAINGIGNERQKLLYRTYDYVETEQFEVINEIPKTLEIDRVEARNTGFLEEDDETVVCLVSMDMLHTDKKVKKNPWYDKPVLAELPHIDFFRFIAGEEGYSSERYMEFCVNSAKKTNQIELTEGWYKNVIKNRASVYTHMCESMELNSEFFQKNAAKAIWNKENGVFNLNSGKHRAAFYASGRRKYIPLRMSKKDYCDFLNENAVRAMEAFFRKEGITQIEYPVPHPFYYDYPCENREFYYRFLYWLIYNIAEDMYEKDFVLDFRKLKIFSAMHDGGFVERALMKAGCIMSIEAYEKEKEIIQLLDNLLHSKIGDVMCGKGSKESYDYVLLDLRGERKVDTYKMMLKNAKKCYAIIEKSCIEKKNRIRFSSVLNGQEMCVVEMEG